MDADATEQRQVMVPDWSINYSADRSTRICGHRRVIIPVGKKDNYNTHFGAYGLGWFLIDAKGYLEVEQYRPRDDGMISEVEMLPELNFGITVLNQPGRRRCRKGCGRPGDRQLSWH